MYPTDFGLANFHSHVSLKINLCLFLSDSICKSVSIFLIGSASLENLNTLTKLFKGSEEKAVGLASRNDSQIMLQN